MKLQTWPLSDKVQTGDVMHKLIGETCSDLDKMILLDKGRPVRASMLPLSRWFRLVKNIPYKVDNKPREVVARPMAAYMFMGGGLDCKKKTILIAAWLCRRGFPYRLISSSRRPDRRITHVFPQGKINGKWVNLDATYSVYHPGKPKRLTAARILPKGKTNANATRRRKPKPNRVIW